jgi:hypothetical protein
LLKLQQTRSSFKRADRKKTEKLLLETPEICVRYSYDEQGNIITLKEKTLFQRSTYPLIKIAAGLIGFLVMLGLPLESLAKMIDPTTTNSNNDVSLQYLAGMPAPIEPPIVRPPVEQPKSTPVGINPIMGEVAYPEVKKEPCEVKKPTEHKLMGKPAAPTKPPKILKGKVKKPK